jgi:hypothetical protein
MFADIALDRVRLLLTSFSMPRVLMPAEEFLCFRSMKTVKDISRRFMLMEMKGLKRLSHEIDFKNFDKNLQN